MNFKKSNFKNNEKYFKQAISLPLYPSIKKKELYKVIKTLNEILG